MARVCRLDSAEQARLVADARRLAILRRLMAAPATLSQLGKVFGKHPAWIRHHLKALESAGLVVLSETRVSGGFVEKYYTASADAYVASELILPALDAGASLVATGSHDLALEMLAGRLAERRHGCRLLPLPLGSLDGLIALRQGVGNLAGCHLLDPEHDEYNLPYVRRLFPGQPMAVVTLAWREQGLLVQRGNPRAIRDLADLARPDVRWANRNRGSGTRVWLDRRLSRLSVPARRVRGYDQELSTHAEVASAVASGQADAGLAIRAAAQARDLDFIPLLKERYDLVLPAEACRDAATTQLLDELQTADFRRATEGLGGYDAADCGAVVLVTG